MRLLLDTNLLVSGSLSQGGVPRELLDAARAGHFELCTSEHLLSELQRVLGYPKLASRLARAQVSAEFIVTQLRALAVVVHTPAEVPRVAEQLGIALQALASYEVGRRRVPVSMLADLARSLGVSIEALLGESVKASAKRGPSSALARQVERIQALPKPKQKFMVQVLESMLAQH